MKLATLKTGDRDGALIIVNTTLTLAVTATDIAKNLQHALDNWVSVAPKLAKRYADLNTKSQATASAGTYNQSEYLADPNIIFSFDPNKVAAPLPRAYQWIDGSAYVNHVELVRKARGAEMPENFWTDPLMYQGGSDSLLGAKDDILVEDLAWGVDFEAEVAVITDDVPMGVSASNASKHIKLFMLVNDISLRNLIPNELSKGFGFFHSKPATAFSPVAVTPDELGAAWHDAKVNLPLLTHLNTKLFGAPNAGKDMTFDFATLIAHAAKTRILAAGTIIGSGTVSNIDRSKGSSCIAEQRMLETIAQGKPVTPFMQYGDHVKIEMFNNEQASIFGAIAQTVTKYTHS